MDQTALLAREFERESYRIDQLIWDAMALRKGETALFCGFTNNLDWIKRAVGIGVEVSVISNDAIDTTALHGIPVTIIRGSTSMLPARDASFDVTVAFHYLHEIDPFFHANVVSEMARAGKRCVIVEPAPPSDPLGLRIASLYSRAKRELGQFEEYHPIDYWRKLLAIAKSDVSYETFTFMRTPPREAMRETVAFIIDTMAAEQTPEPYLRELRALAARPDAQLVPQARYVVVGTAVGELKNVSAGTNFRDYVADVRPRRADSRYDIAENGSSSPAGATPHVYSPPDTQAEFPTVEPPARRANAPLEPAPLPSQIARNAFGLPAASEDKSARQPLVPSIKGDEPAPVFGVPAEANDAAAEFGWEWDTPGS